MSKFTMSVGSRHNGSNSNQTKLPGTAQKGSKEAVVACKHLH